MERFDDKCDNLNDDRLDFRMFLNLFSQLTQIHIQLQHSILHKPLNLTIQNIHLLQQQLQHIPLLQNNHHFLLLIVRNDFLQEFIYFNFGNH